MLQFEDDVAYCNTIIVQRFEFLFPWVCYGSMPPRQETTPYDFSQLMDFIPFHESTNQNIGYFGHQSHE